MHENMKQDYPSDDKSPIIFRLREFYSKFKVKAITFGLVSQLLIAGMSILLFTVVSSSFDESQIAITITIFVSVSEIISVFLIIAYAFLPFRIFAKILDEHDDPEASAINLNDGFYSRFGMKKFSYSVSKSVSDSRIDALSIKGDDQAASFSNREDFKNIFEELPVGVIGLGSDGRIIYANSRAPIAVDGRIELDFSNKETSLRDFLVSSRKNSIQNENNWIRVQNHAPKNDDDSRKIYDVLASYHRNAPSGVEILIVTIDRTNYYLEDEDAMDFVALAAHELRGPITVIRGYLDILSDEFQSQTKQQQEIFDRLNVSAKRLSSYVSNILNVSHYDHKHMRLDLTKTEVADMIGDICEDMELRARTSGRNIVFSIPNNLPSVAADRSSIGEVLINLIDNAVKYSYDGGTVEVFAKTEGQWVQVSVRDHGIGIPDNVAQNLFDKFYRSHKSSGVVGGSGLGLYISRAIIESHGGHISVQSVEGGGSVFTFMLPTFESVENMIADGNESLIRADEPKITNHGFVEN